MEIKDLHDMEKHFDNIYVRQEDCEDYRSKAAEKFSQSENRLARIETILKILTTLTGFIAASAVTEVIKVIFNLI